MVDAENEIDYDAIDREANWIIENLPEGERRWAINLERGYEIAAEYGLEHARRSVEKLSGIVDYIEFEYPTIGCGVYGVPHRDLDYGHSSLAEKWIEIRNQVDDLRRRGMHVTYPADIRWLEYTSHEWLKDNAERALQKAIDRSEFAIDVGAALMPGHRHPRLYVDQDYQANFRLYCEMAESVFGCPFVSPWVIRGNGATVPEATWHSIIDGIAANSDCDGVVIYGSGPWSQAVDRLLAYARQELIR